jgi:hypothetical protein
MHLDQAYARSTKQLQAVENHLHSMLELVKAVNPTTYAQQVNKKVYVRGARLRQRPLQT